MKASVHLESAFDSVMACLVAASVVACFIFVLIVFPDVTDALRLRIRRRSANVINRNRRRGRAWRNGLFLAVRWMRGAARNALTLSLAFRWLIPALCTAIVAPAAVILTLKRGTVALDAFDATRDSRSEATPAVAALFQGEHLVAPPPLPPEMFSTREVELVRPALAHASRVWSLLDDVFAQQLLRVYRLMKERHGYEMVLIEGYRSPERQDELAAAGGHVTNAAAWQSYHQYGLAADSAFLKDGRVVISEKDPWAMRGYRLFGEVAAEVGLTWGGNWKLMDLGHVELRRAGARVRAAR